MSELLDNQVDTQNENMKINIPGFTQALVEVAMKIKNYKKKKTTTTQIFYSCIRRLARPILMNFGLLILH